VTKTSNVQQSLPLL